MTDPKMRPESKRAIACASCGKSAQVSSRLPNGWKRRGEEYSCADCWRKRYVLRALTFRAYAAAGADGRPDWASTTALLAPLWRATTECANWMTRQLAISEPFHEPGAKLAPMLRTYLYPEARRLFPGLEPRTVSSLEQAATRKYRARRLECVAWNRASLPSYKYPQPIPVHNAAWRPYLASAAGDPEAGDQLPWVSLRVSSERRIELRLATKGHHRQLAGFMALLTGEAVPGEASVWQPSGGGLRVKLVAWLPRAAPADAKSATLHVRAGGDPLVVAVSGGRIWSFHGDHWRRRAAEHRIQIQRWSDDQKAEQRPVPSFAARRERAVHKYRRRMDSATHELAAMIVNYASRRRLTKIKWSESSAGVLPIEELRRKAAEKADRAGIEFCFDKEANAEALEAVQKALAKEELVKDEELTRPQRVAAVRPRDACRPGARGKAAKHAGIGDLSPGPRGDH